MKFFTLSIKNEPKKSKMDWNDLLEGDYSMLKVQEIREIIKLIDQSSIDEFSFESNGAKVKLKKNNGNHSTEYPTQSSTFYSEPIQVPTVAVKPTTQQPVQEVVAEATEEK